jgi:hypothetical protein
MVDIPAWIPHAAIPHVLLFRVTWPLPSPIPLHMVLRHFLTTGQVFFSSQRILSSCTTNQLVTNTANWSTGKASAVRTPASPSTGDAKVCGAWAQIGSLM